jgi:glycosyltransferase involved in cell wall biosynthesis
VARIAEDLEAAGHRVTRYWRNNAEWLSPDGPRQWKQPFLLWRNPSVLKDLESVQLRERADVWLLHNVIPVISLGVYGLAKRLGVPIVQWLHNYRPLSPGGELAVAGRPLDPRDPWRVFKETWEGTWHGSLITALLAAGYWWLWARRDFAAVKAWVTISEGMKRIFETSQRYRGKLYAVRHCWHITMSVPAVREHTQAPGHFLFLGRMVTSKGVRFLLDLWRRPEMSPSTLILAGKGPLFENGRPDLPPNVRWVGHVDGEAKTALLDGSRAVLVPSLWPEPLGTVAYEAFERSKPVVASAVGGLTELVVDRVTGRLLPPGDAASWQAALSTLDAAQAGQWGRAGRQWLEANASPTRWNRDFDAMIAQALDGHAPGSDKSAV